jgi:hypothetical protein
MPWAEIDVAVSATLPPASACTDSLISCSGVMFPKEIAHEYREGRRGQALDGASEVGSVSGHHSKKDDR